MIRSVLSLATLRRQPNNVTCCTGPPDPTLTPAGSSRFVSSETIAHLLARQSPASQGYTLVLWISFISSARREGAHAVQTARRNYHFVRAHVCLRRRSLFSRNFRPHIREFRVSALTSGNRLVLCTRSTNLNTTTTATLSLFDLGFHESHGKKVPRETEQSGGQIYIFPPPSFDTTKECAVPRCNIGLPLDRYNRNLLGQRKKIDAKRPPRDISRFTQLKILNCVLVI